MEQINIDKLLQQAAQVPITAPNDSWPIIRDALHNKNRKRVLWYWLLPLIIGCFAVGYLVGTNATTILKQPNAQAFKSKIKYKKVDSKISESASTFKNVEYTYNKEQLIFNKNESNFIKNNYKVKLNNTATNINTKHKIEYNVINGTKKDVVINIENEKLTKNNNIEYTETVTEPENKLNNNKTITPIEINQHNNNVLNDTITTKVLMINKNIEVAKNTKRQNKKWQFSFQTSIGSLLISESNLINTLAEKSVNSNNNLTLASGNVFTPTPQYSKASTASVKLLAQKNIAKKLELQIGIQLQQNKFLTEMYATPLENNIFSTSIGTILIDRNGLLNGGGALPTIPLSNKPFYKQNKIIHIGAIVGLQIPILKFNTTQKIILQTQIVPSISLRQNINWFNKSTNRFFAEKNAEKQITSFQNISLQYAINGKKYQYSIGPFWQFNSGTINKQTANTANLYLNTVGLQAAFKLQ